MNGLPVRGSLPGGKGKGSRLFAPLYHKMKLISMDANTFLHFTQQTRRFFSPVASFPFTTLFSFDRTRRSQKKRKIFFQKAIVSQTVRSVKSSFLYDYRLAFGTTFHILKIFLIASGRYIANFFRKTFAFFLSFEYNGDKIIGEYRRNSFSSSAFEMIAAFPPAINKGGKPCEN